MIMFFISILLSIILNHKQLAFGLFENLFGGQPPCLAKKDTPMKNGFSVYQNSEHKVQIQYPVNWAKED